MRHHLSRVWVLLAAVGAPALLCVGTAPLAAHGTPMDIWTVAVADVAVRRITSFNEDEPVPAWEPEGQTLVVLATGGLYQVDVGERAVRRIGDGTFGGSVDVNWR